MQEIDFVVFWVDGSDPEWQQKKARYKGTPQQAASVRYRDWDILKYWFRAVETYAPWVRHIYFVADNQRPSWLNFDHPKLSFVDHRDFIPEEFLPTFQANTIEDNLHRIKGLSEQFVVFNDDMFINAPIAPDYYFRNGMPCDAPYEHLFTAGCYNPKTDGWGINVMEFCDTHVVNAYFDRRKVVAQNRRAWYGHYLGLKYWLQARIIGWFRRSTFQHFYTPHNEKAFLKTTYQELWEREPEMLTKSCTKFRENMSLNNYVFRYWQLASNKFYPVNQLRAKQVVQLGADNLDQVERLMFDAQVKSLCLNDSSDLSYEDYESLKPRLSALFERKLPTKSQFEV